MHGEKQLIFFLIISSIMLVCAEVAIKRNRATPRYMVMGVVWVVMVAMLLWTYQE